MPELIYDVDARGDVTFPATEHTYRAVLKARGPPSITLLRGTEVVEDARIDPHDERDRRRFAQAPSLNGTATAVVRELKVLAGLLDDGKAGRRPAGDEATGAAVGHDGPRLTHTDFLAYLPESKFIYGPTGKLWTRAGVNDALAPVEVGTTALGEPLLVPATEWITVRQPVHDMTWAPGQPSVILGRFLDEGGWVEKAGARTYNGYRPPRGSAGDAAEAGPWVAHVERVYPLDAGHVLDWLAHRVQRPGEKVNHAVVLGGEPGIGKDTILEPVKQAVGPWNFGDVSPSQLVGRFNAFLRSVVLRVSELRDLGDVNRYGFYEHTKTVIAAPPDCLLVDEKNVRAYRVPNVVAVVFTTNHRTDGLYLPADDRRHYVAWSDLTAADFPADYWTRLYGWFAGGGGGHVAAYLMKRDLSRFDPKAPPFKTRAFWDVVDAGRAPEDADLADALDFLGTKDDAGQALWRKAVTVAEVVTAANRGEAWGDSAFAAWLKDRKNSRQMPHRFDAVGYVKVRNPGAADGLWKVGGRRMAVYAMKTLSDRDKIAAATELQARYEGTNGPRAGQ